MKKLLADIITCDGTYYCLNAALIHKCNSQLTTKCEKIKMLIKK